MVIKVFVGSLGEKPCSYIKLIITPTAFCRGAILIDHAAIQK
jgi:hypothetical protein